MSISTNGKKDRKGYQWPADQLTAEEMAILYRLRAKTGTPINRLLKEARQKLEEQNKQASRDVEEENFTH